jgi:hypothetical protein
VERGVGASGRRCGDSIDAARDGFAGEEVLRERLLMADSGRSGEMRLIGELFLGLGVGLAVGLAVGLPWLPAALSANKAASNSSLVILEGDTMSSRFLDENASGNSFVGDIFIGDVFVNPFIGDVFEGDVRSFRADFLSGLEILNTLCGASSSNAIPPLVGVCGGATFSWFSCSMWDMKGDEGGSCHELSM